MSYYSSNETGVKGSSVACKIHSRQSLLSASLEQGHMVLAASHHPTQVRLATADKAAHDHFHLLGHEKDELGANNEPSLCNATTHC